MSENIKDAIRKAAAAGPDREIDAAIWWCFVADHSKDSPEFSQYAKTHSAAKTLDYAWGRIWRDSGPVPFYTSSIDAALTLVPEGWMWSVHGGAGVYPSAQLDRDGDDSPSGEIFAEAVTSIIALCIAALKAKDPAS